MPTIDLEKKHLDEAPQILKSQAPDCEVRAFGSRVTGDSRQNSDSDLALVSAEKLNWRRMEAMKDAFSEIDLSFVVDVLDWNAVDNAFRETIKEKSVVLQQSIHHPQ